MNSHTLVSNRTHEREGGSNEHPLGVQGSQFSFPKGFPSMDEVLNVMNEISLTFGMT